MKMTKTYKRLCTVLGLSLVCGTGMVSATSGSKTIQATYRNINVTYNGAAQSIDVEPFSVNGSVYVPLRAVSNILGVGADWVPATNTVVLTGTNSNTSSVDSSTIAAYQTQIQNLATQLAAAQSELAELKKTNSTTNNNSTTTSGSTAISAASLNDTANYLYANYSDALNSNIDLSFELTQKASRLQLDISYTTSSENTKFDSISENKVKSFIKSVCEDIVSRHGSVPIQGAITYSKSDIDKVSFSVTAAGSYSYDFGLKEDDVKEIIDDSTDGYLTLGSLGKQTISTIDATIKNNKINFSIYLTSTAANLKPEDVTKNWNNIANQASISLRSQLRDVISDIDDESNGDFTISGSVYTSDNKLMAEIDSDGSITVYTI